MSKKRASIKQTRNFNRVSVVTACGVSDFSCTLSGLSLVRLRWWFNVRKYIHTHTYTNETVYVITLVSVSGCISSSTILLSFSQFLNYSCELLNEQLALCVCVLEETMHGKLLGWAWLIMAAMWSVVNFRNGN